LTLKKYSSKKKTSTVVFHRTK